MADEIYECPKCGQEYDTEEDAEECCASVEDDEDETD